MEYIIRRIKEDEVKDLFKLLIELAQHEKIDDRLKITSDKMATALFGSNADWHCLVAVTSENEIIGFSLFTFANINRAFNLTPLLHIDDIFVKSSYRQLGIAKHLLVQMAEIANLQGIERIELWCIKDNVLGQAFYQRLGARKLDFLDVYQLEVQELIADNH
ncbi:MAG: GNAT family N-acetyltransferase [Proteobacteria bacterium]|nr:GNAT family N-acetyltransferase [Pseudomonadota bacterium]